MVLYKTIFLAAIVTLMIYQAHGSEIDKFIPEACRNKVYCTDEDFRKDNITNIPFLDQFMKDLDMSTLEELEPIPYKPELDDQDEGEDDCASEPRATVTLLLVRERNHEKQPWFTVPHTSKYKQRVSIQKCKTRSSPCFVGFKIQNDGKAVCVQEYTAMVVHILDKETKEIKTLDISLPAYCSCKIKEEDYDY